MLSIKLNFRQIVKYESNKTELKSAAFVSLAVKADVLH